MYNLATTVLSTLLQAGLMLAVPFVWWLVTARRRNFFTWLGWTRPVAERPGRLVLVMIGTVVASAAISLLLVPALTGKTSNSIYTGMGLVALPAMLVGALVQTSLLEECVFRGFLLKRVANRFGFVAGNTVQGAAFGLIHAIPFNFLGVSPLVALVLGVFTGALGALMGWINERMAGGSLVPSYLIHAAANVFGAVLVLVGIV